MMYRDKFHGDVVIDLVGYRRHGHNEGDEPSYTQPLMYERIRQTPTVRQHYAEQLAARGRDGRRRGPGRGRRRVRTRCSEIQQALKASLRRTEAAERSRSASRRRPMAEPDTAVPRRAARRR